ncbi:MAG: hypothetical protein WC465_02415 [Patescibacteria group bacterium]
MSAAIASLLLLVVIIIAIAHHTGPNKDEIAAIQDSAAQMMNAALMVYYDQGLNATVNYCNAHQEQIKTRVGLIEISYNITGDCYSPDDTVVTRGNTTILPTSVYGRIDDFMLHKLDQGYCLRDVSISVIARLNGRMGNLIFLTRAVDPPST